MGLEVRPVSIGCNLNCKYCYQHTQRALKNFSAGYDLEKIKSALEHYTDSFTLFGGEPLLMPIPDLEHLFKWGFERYGKNALQTNGTLITEKHIALFRKYNVEVGISMDGPEVLNDLRSAFKKENTLKMTRKTQSAIVRLCDEGINPGLIVTLHKGNATPDKLPKMHEWFKFLDNLGLRSVRLHLLEIENKEIRNAVALSVEENIEALKSFIQLEGELKNIRFDITAEIKNLLLGKDQDTSCVWRACDPLSTPAVLGIEGDGSQSKCGRVNKDGIDYLKPDTPGFERYIALYTSPRDKGGCKDCRFFLFCKGQCPGTAIDGDWRNRTEHCEIWRYLFIHMEKLLVLEGHTPLSIHPVRKVLELNMIDQWKKGSNPSIASLSGERTNVGTTLHSFKRFTWISEEQKAIWMANSPQGNDAVEHNLGRIISGNAKNGIRIISFPEGKMITNED